MNQSDSGNPIGPPRLATLSIGGRRLSMTVRQGVGLVVVLLACIALVFGLPVEPGPEAWYAVAGGAVLFLLERAPPVQWLFERAGGIVVAALIGLFLLGTGGTDAVLQDLFVVILVYGVIVYGWTRLAVDFAAVTVAAVTVGVLGGGDATYYLDLVADLLVWALVAAIAGVLEGRMQAATASSRRLRVAIDEVEDVVTVIDAETLRIDYGNRRAAALAGVGPGELIGRHPWELDDGLSEVEVRGLVAELSEDGPTVQLEHTLRRSDPPRTYETRARLVTGPADGPKLVFIARDVTEARHAAAAARESAAMVEAADTAMIGADDVGWIRSWNRAAEGLYGVSRSAAVGRHAADVLGSPPDDPAHSVHSYPLAQRFVRYSTRHTRADGTQFDAEVTAWPVAASSGTAPGVALIVRDVTEQRRAAGAVRQREEWFRTFAEQARGVVYRIQLVPTIELTYISPRVTEVLGDDPHVVMADPSALFDRIHPDDGRPVPDVDGVEDRTAEGVHTYRVRRTDGTWVWLEDHHRPQLDAGGRAVATQGILFDVSARKQLDQARQQALEHERRLAIELERTTMAQQTFLRSISHELRTPLTAVRGFAHTLRTHWTQMEGDQTDQFLARLVANVERLDAQLADLLDLDLGRADSAPVSWEQVDVRSVCRAAVGSIDTGHHHVLLEVDEVEVRGDRVRLDRAVTAMVRNAVRHTPPGTTVTISTRVDADSVGICVADDGPGVDESILDTMFEPFVQGTAAATAASPGAGVGLALAREVAALHGGSLEHRQRQSGGSSFCLTIPRAGEGDADSDVRAQRP